MKNLRKSSRRAISAMLTAVFLSQQTMVLSAFATNITNVQGNNGVYDISPTSVLKNSDIGLRKYERFELSQGDIANLIYKYGSKDVNTFLNLVDNTIQINGIVNTMRNGNFYNGKAVFVSPNGMVVGASGVLNVGSLGVYTPNNDVYNRFKNNPNKDLSVLSDKNNVGSGSVKIDGHVFAANDIDVVSSRIQVPGKVLAGTGNDAVFDGRQRADELFNSIVNTSKMTSANEMTAKNGVISFASTVGTAITGDIQNVGTGSTNITNTGSKGVYISGNVANRNGDLNIDNSAGSVYGAKTSNIENHGGILKIVNTGKGIYFVKDSQITNDNNLVISNTGAEGTILAGNVNNKGNAFVDNKAGVLSVAGNFDNNGNATFTNSGTQLNVSGKITNKNGKLKLNNSGAKGLNIVKTGNVQSEGIEITNSGNNGLNISGTVNNNGTAIVNNTTTGVEGLNISGTFTNNGNATISNTGRDGLNITGTVNNKNGKLTMDNTGVSGLNVSKTGKVDAQGLAMSNSGANGLNVYGTVNNAGDGTYTNTSGSFEVHETGKMVNKGGTATYTNSGANGFVISGEVNNEGTTIANNENGPLSIGGKFTNKGNSTFTNKGTQLNIAGTVENTDGMLKLNNSGADGLNIVSTGVVTSEGLEVLNTGAKGLNVNGTVTNAGNASFTNSGANGLNVGKNAKITSDNINKDSLSMHNTGNGGLNISGNVSTLGNATYTNTETGAKGLNIYGKTHTQNGNTTFINDGKGGLNIYGETRNTVGLTTMTNNGANGLNVKSGGLVFADNANLTNNGAAGLNVAGTAKIGVNGNLVNNGQGGLNVYGLVEHGIIDSHAPQGTLNLVNNGTNGLNVRENGKVISTSTKPLALSMENNGAEGLNILGDVNVNGNAKIVNNVGGRDGLNVAGNLTDKNGKLTMLNDGSRGINVTKTGSINAQGIEMVNNGETGLNVWGTVNNTGDGIYTNNAGSLDVKESGKMSNKGGTATYYNKGVNGLVISGEVNNEGTTIANNENGPLSIGGKFTNKGNSTFTNSGEQLNISGTVNNDGKLILTNSGAKGLNIISTANVSANDTEITNSGTQGLNISGNVKIDGNGKISNTGAYGLNISGKIEQNGNGSLSLTNDGQNGLNIGKTAVVNSKNISVENNGRQGLNIAGTVNNNGNASFKNNENARNGFNITGTINNENGNLELLNDGFIGLQVREGGVVNAQGLKMVNNGENGMYVKGTVNNKGNGTYTNNAGTLKVSETGKLSNKGGTADFYNKGVNGFVVAGTIDNEGTTNVVNDNGVLSIGGTLTNKGNTTLTNNGSQLNIHGTVNNTNGNLTLNNTKGDIQVVNTGVVNSEGLKMNNTGADGINVYGKVSNKGAADIKNSADGVKGVNVYGSVANEGNLNITNDGADGVNVFGKVSNSNGKATIVNNGAKGLNVSPAGEINAQGLEMVNNGEKGMNIWGTVNNQGDGTYTNNAGSLDVKESGKMSNIGGTANYYNNGEHGLVISGEVNNEGTTIAFNDNGPLSIGGKFTNKGNATFTNAKGEQLNISGTVTNTEGKLTLNNAGEKGLNIVSTGKVDAQDVEMNNSGEAGLNIRGNVNALGNIDIVNAEGGKGGLNIGGHITQGNSNSETAGHVNLSNKGEGGTNIYGTISALDSVTSENVGEKGTYIDSKASIKSGANVAIGDASEAGTKVRGLVNARENVYMTEVGGDIVIGDGTENNNYITAGKDIAIDIHNGNLKNIGVEKVLLKADGNLDVKVVDGSIGEEPAQGVTRDFKKSINANIKGKVNEQTVDTTVMKEKDFVINYAAIDSDMNIDTIKADGKVILTVDDDYGKTNDGARYNMVNVKTDTKTTNIEGKGISLISNGSIGKTITNPDGSEVTTSVTFIQTGAEQGYTMDALANEDISLYENSYNDVNYGRDKEVKANKVTTMIAREGDLEVEFAGDTKIDNITAEGDLIVTTRGQKLDIENLGSIKDGNQDYFGVRNNGRADGGYTNADHASEVLPDNVDLTALDINHNIRPTQELVDGNHEAYAQSEVTVKNAVLDNGQMDITADNIKANGIELTSNKDGVEKRRNTATNKVVGADGIPTAHSVRENDVTYVGRSETERNYYRFQGDGDGVYNGRASNVDNDDNIFDATPLEMEDDLDDASQMWKQKVDNSNVAGTDKRQYMRFNITTNQIPVSFEQKAGASSLIDISRGGIAIAHEGNLKVGDVIPVHIVYGDLDINADAKIVSTTATRAGAEFVNIDKSLANQLLYLNILLEGKYNKLANN